MERNISFYKETAYMLSGTTRLIKTMQRYYIPATLSDQGSNFVQVAMTSLTYPKRLSYYVITYFLLDTFAPNFFIVRKISLFRLIKIGIIRINVIIFMDIVLE